MKWCLRRRRCKARAADRAREADLEMDCPARASRLCRRLPRCPGRDLDEELEHAAADRCRAAGLKLCLHRQLLQAEAWEAATPRVVREAVWDRWAGEAERLCRHLHR
jgi:hypothetical protein